MMYVYHYIPNQISGFADLGLIQLSEAGRDIKQGEIYHLYFAVPLENVRARVGDYVSVDHVSFKVIGISGDSRKSRISVAIVDASPWLYVIYGVGTLLGVGGILYLGSEAAKETGKAVEQVGKAALPIGGLLLIGLLIYLLMVKG